jgi:transcriptional regulator with XRE-family HTH domain
MNKSMSTDEQKMQDKQFKKAYEQLFSELLISIMKEENKSVRNLAKEACVSTSVIQGLRSGRQTNVKLSNLIKIAKSLGYEVVLQKGEKRLALHHEEIKNDKNRLSVVAPAN